MTKNLSRQQFIAELFQSGLNLAYHLPPEGSRLEKELRSVPVASQSISSLASHSNPSHSNQRVTVAHPHYRFESDAALRFAKAQAVQAYFQSMPKTCGLPIGLACSTDRQDHSKSALRLYKVFQTEEKTRLMSVTISPSTVEVSKVQDLVMELGLRELGCLLGSTYQPIKPFTQLDTETTEVVAKPGWSEVFHNRIACCRADSQDTLPPQNVGILSGSFDPLHSGHLEMASLFERRSGQKVHFELAIRNLDKPPLDYISIQQRLNQFDSQVAWLTNLPSFAEKSTCFPGNVFLVGADTIARIANSRYYPDAEGFKEAIDRIAQNQCRFCVFGRLAKQKFISLADLELPSQLRDLCDEIPETEFRNDISSTRLRK